MRSYRKFKFVYRYIYKRHGKQNYNIHEEQGNFYNYDLLSNKFMIYSVRYRNKFINLVDNLIYPVYMKSFNSLLILQKIYKRNVVLSLYIEFIVYYLVMYRWRCINIVISGIYYGINYFYKYMSYIYKKWQHQFLKIKTIKLDTKVSYSFIRKMKYPRRKRRFKRAV